MSLIFKLGLDMVKMYLHTKSLYVKQLKGYSLNKWTHRHTDTHADMTGNITYPHTWVVTKYRIRKINFYIKMLSHFTLKNVKCLVIHEPIQMRTLV